MMAVAAAGAIVGDSIGYEIGRHFGNALQASRLGRKVGAERWQRAETYLEAKGGRAIFAGRFVGVLRALVPAVAGATRMPYRRFLVWNALGAIMGPGHGPRRLPRRVLLQAGGALRRPGRSRPARRRNRRHGRRPRGSVDRSSPRRGAAHRVQPGGPPSGDIDRNPLPIAAHVSPRPLPSGQRASPSRSSSPSSRRQGGRSVPCSRTCWAATTRPASIVLSSATSPLTAPAG